MFLKNYLKGMLFGLFSMLPGLSGGMMASYTGDYSKCIDIVVERRFNRDTIMYLISLILGFVIGVIVTSSILLHFFNQYGSTFKLFIIIVNVGILFSLLKVNFMNIKKLLITTLLSTIIYIGIRNVPFNSNNILLSSFIYSFSKVVPGISSTSLLISFGIYDQLLLFFSKPISSFTSCIFYWSTFWVLFIIYSILLVIVMYYINKKYKFDKVLIIIQIVNILLLLN